jgi:hypothetical protein
MPSCVFVELPDGQWWCPFCGGRLQLRLTRRWCGPQPTGPPTPQPPMPAPQWFRWRWGQGDCAGVLPLDELMARLDRCLGSECEHLVEGVCTRGNVSSCKRREVWFAALMLGSPPCQSSGDQVRKSTRSPGSTAVNGHT